MMNNHRPGRRPAVDTVRAVLALGMVVGLGAIGTSAAWTDQSTAVSGQFSSGSIDLKLGATAVDNNPPAFTSSLALSTMKPGDSKDVNLPVRNRGSVPFTYTIAGTATNNGAADDQLGSAMQLQIYPGSDCTGTVLNSPSRFTFSTTTARPLAAGADETLCFRATLPPNADSAVQGKSTVATFTFTATSS